VQNAVSPREIGVATSSVTFFRQMGGTIGTAAFLSVLFSALGDKVPAAYAAAGATPEFQAAAAANPDQAAQLQGAGSNLADTSIFQRIDSVLAAPFKDGFSSSIDLVFLIAAGVVALGFFVLVFLPQLELRTTSAAQDAAGAQAAEGEGTTDGTTDAAARSANAVGAAAPTSAAATAAPSQGGAPALDEPTDTGRHAVVTDQPAGRHEDVGPDHGKHEGDDGRPTGLDSIPADHLPAGRPKD
jgi:hypothetical protein